MTKPSYLLEYEKWRSSPRLDPALRAPLEAMAGNDKAIESAFYAPLSFGTAGLRGEMGPGIARMNVHTVAQTTQGLASLIREQGGDAAARGVAVAYDCRNLSVEFSRIVSGVLAANGIRVFLFDELRPTPELSYAIRKYNCISGVNITASHNPKEYNGYKVYWEDGAQLPPDHARIVSAYIEKTDIFDGILSRDFDGAVADGTISFLGRETDDAFLDEILSFAVNPEEVARSADEFRLVYTPFHGAGYRLVPEALARLGFKHLLCEPSQMALDGNFPTVKSPNPEDKAGFAAAIALARENNVDLIIGTDPDADRVGIVLRDDAGDYVTLSGNQVGVLLLHYIVTAKKEKGTLSDRPAAVKSIVSTEMVRAVCERHGVKLYDCFTGFKFIAEKMNALLDAGEQFLLGFEESYGYLCGTHARDKDAVGASAMIAEMAAYYHNRGKTLFDVMNECYAEYGFFSEKTISLTMPGLDGLARMAALMARLRAEPPASLGGIAVSSWIDYLPGLRHEGADTEALPLRDSDVLSYRLCDGTVFVVRPSGTEPKVKVYILASGSDRAALDGKISLLSDEAKAFAAG